MKTALALTLLVTSALTCAALSAGEATADRSAPAKVAPAKSRAAQVAATAAATLAQIEKEMGFVPAFVKSVPPTLLPTWWQLGTSFEDSADTKLDGKTKQLISLAVAAQVPCEYCVYYHSEVLRALGASEEELQEAVAMAGLARANSTMLNGMQVDKAQFKRDVDRLIRAMRAAPRN